MSWTYKVAEGRQSLVRGSQRVLDWMCFHIGCTQVLCHCKVQRQSRCLRRGSQRVLESFRGRHKCPVTFVQDNHSHCHHHIHHHHQTVCSRPVNVTSWFNVIQSDSMNWTMRRISFLHMSLPSGGGVAQFPWKEGACWSFGGLAHFRWWGWGCLNRRGVTPCPPYFCRSWARVLQPISLNFTFSSLEL